MCKSKMGSEMQANHKNLLAFKSKLEEVDKLNAQQLQEEEQAKEIAKQKAFELAKAKLQQKKKEEKVKNETKESKV